MPTYTYTAKSQPAKIIQGDIEAESEQDAINKLTKNGFFPVSVKSKVVSFDDRDIWRFRKFLNKDVVLFTRQLSSLIDSGVNIINGLNIIVNQTHNKYLKVIVRDVANKIKDGKSLSDSMASHPYLFSDLYSSMVRVGEASGNLNKILKRLADFLEEQEEFKESLRASLTYPFFVFSVGVLTIFVLLTFVIPRLVTMFEDMGQVLPLPTRILIGMSGFLRSYWWFILIAMIILVFLLRRTYQTPQGKIAWDKFKLKLFIFGPIILKTEVSRLMRTLSLLLSSGIPITPALDISLSIVGNQVLKSDIRKFQEEIAAGSSLSVSLKNSFFFPDFVTNIITIGEETGSLEKSLMRIADDYENDVSRSLKTLTRLLEPFIILVMGLIVGFIVLSMLLPIFQINLIVR